MTEKNAPCANCELDAIYIYEVTSTSAILYCEEHLPKFLYPRKTAGTLKTTKAQKALVDEALNILAADSQVIVDNIEEVIEEAKPKAKTSTKKAEPTPTESE
jgi:hypothetical protein